MVNKVTSRTLLQIRAIYLSIGLKRYGVVDMGTVLIVENNSFFRRMLKDSLEAQVPALTVYEADNGMDAFHKIGIYSPDVVFLDIRLPGKNGLELTKAIKNGYPGIAVAIITSYDLPEYRETAYKNGADFFFPKDCMCGSDIAAVVNSVLMSKPGRAVRVNNGVL